MLHVAPFDEIHAVFVKVKHNLYFSWSWDGGELSLLFEKEFICSEVKRIEWKEKLCERVQYSVQSIVQPSVRSSKLADACPLSLVFRFKWPAVSFVQYNGAMSFYGRWINCVGGTRGHSLASPFEWTLELHVMLLSSQGLKCPLTKASIKLKCT